MSLQTRLAELIVAIKGAIPTIDVAYYRASTATNVNASTAGIDIPWDNVGDRDEGSVFQIRNGSTSVFVAGTPRYVQINVNIKISISNTAAIARPNQVVRLIRSDGRVLASSATGYIRDAGDHEESSYNFSVMDVAPITNGEYRVVSFREGSNGNTVSLNPSESQLDLLASFS